MALTRLFVQRATLGFVFVALTLIAGFIAMRSLVIQEQPDTGLPAVGINVAYSGASTSELRDTIARPIENALSGTPNLDHTDTVIQTGSVRVTASFTLGSSDSVNLTNVQKALQTAQGQLPADLIAPTINTANPSEPVVVTIALTSKKYSPERLANLASNSIVPVLEQVPGVSTVNVKGQTQPAYVVAVDPALLAASNLTLTDVIDAIEPNNVRAPGGIVYQPGVETQIDIRGDITTPASVAALPIHVTSPTTAISANVAAGGSATTATSGIATVSGAPGTISNAPATGAVTVPVATATTASYGTGAAMAQAITGSAQSGPGQATSPPAPTASASASSSGAASLSTIGTSTSGASATAGTSAIRPPIGQPITVTAQQPSSAQPATNSTAAGATAANTSIASGGAGTSLSPFVGAFALWTNPSLAKRIADVATVRAGSAPLRVYAHENGINGIGLDVQKATSASEVTVADAVLADQPTLRAEFPDIDFVVEHVQATYTRQQLEGVEHTLFEGIALTAIVMLFFLKSWRNAVVVLVSIPTSLGVTLIAMRAFNLTLDTISLLAMTLVIGILIDDSTVVLENSVRHRDQGDEPADAAVNGRSEIGMAAIVITLVDVVVFLPIAFVGGAVGKQLSEFGLVISIATLTSLFVSFTVTPALMGLWSLHSTWKPWPIIERFDALFVEVRRRYIEQWLPAVLRRPAPILIVAVLLCAGAFVLIPLGIVGEEYIPQGDQGEIFVQVQFPNGTPLEKTKRVMFALEQRVKPLIGADLDAFETTAGSYDAPFGGPAQEGNVGQIHLWLTDQHETSSSVYVARLQDEANRMAAGATVIVKPASAQGGGPKQPIDVLVQASAGNDPSPYAKKIAAALRATPGTSAVSDSSSNVAPQVNVEFDRSAAQLLDVSIGTAATAIRAALGGAQAAQIETADNGLTEIEVIYPRADQTSLAGILAIPVRTNNGGIVRIGDFANLRSAPASLLITRENRADIIHVSANVADGYQLSNVVNDFNRRVAALNLPPGVLFHAAPQGQQDLMRQTLSSLSGSLFFSLILVFLMIVALYNSVRTPFVTLFSIPLATIGAFGALAITHQTLNLYSLIGMVLLVGLVTKNGILLVDFADIERRRGKDRDAAMLSVAKERFRPILMTTIAMIAGMTPLALGFDPGASQRSSLGITVIGGLLSSLALTLFIVPIIYRRLAPHTMMQVTRLQATRTRE